MTQPAPESRRCCCCAELRPASEFRRIYRDRPFPLHSECRECHAERERERRKQRRERETGKTITRIGRHRTQPAVNREIRALLQACGGVQGLCDHLQQLRREKPASPQVCRLYRALLNASSLTERAHSQAQAAQARADALRHRHGNQDLPTEDLLPFAAKLLRNHGWTVRRPHRKEG